MALNPLKIVWLEQLYRDGVFIGKKSLLDCGPQDLKTSRMFIRKTVAYRFDPATLDSILDRIFDEKGKTRLSFQRWFYALWGISEYQSIDFNDSRADLRLDLNMPVNIGRKFDMVKNFGTAEHIFNIGMFYRNMHTLLVAGGLALHVTPCFGDINHGFFNIHPNVYSQLIRSNAYQQHSLLYVDNYAYKNDYLHATNADFSFRSMVIDLGAIDTNFGDMHALGHFREKVYRNFVENTVESPYLPYARFPKRGILDYVFCCFEKQNETPFVLPQQYTAEAQLKAN